MNTPPRVVLGYHGCDARLLDRIVSGKSHLSASNNRYDWLGQGVYFWENGPQRALEFAEWKLGRGEIESPVVVGALINLGRCFDLADSWAPDQLAGFNARLILDLASANQEVPMNRRANEGDFDLILRNRDCAVVNYAMAAYDKHHGSRYFQTVRGIFIEGGPAYPAARISRRAHV